MKISADWLVDGGGSAPLRHAQVHVDGEKISRIESVDPKAPADRRFAGCTILPGLIDAHVHLTFAAARTSAEVVAQVSADSEAALLETAIHNAQAALKAGITTLRDCGGRGLVTLRVRDLIRQGQVAGPDVLVSGMPITTHRGHLYYLGLTADTEPEVRAAAEQMVEAGVDFIKIVATGGNMTPGSDRFQCQYDDAGIQAAVDVGRRAGLHTAAHVLSRCALPQCIKAGVRTIEHCAWRINEITTEFDPELARRMVANDQYASFTMSGPTWRSVFPHMAGLDKAIVGDLNARFESEQRTIAAGVRYLLHTDAGVRQTPFGESLAIGVQAAAKELRLTPVEAIRAVTGSPAAALGLHDRGVLMPGRRADLIVVAGNPLIDLSALRRIKAVMRGGQWL